MGCARTESGDGELAAMVMLMSGATAAIGLLPTWSAAGVAVPVALVLLRLIQGFASGGEISTSIPYLMESVPARHWGYYGGWHTATVAAGVASGIATAGLVSAVMPTDSLLSWGWRVPFLVALPLGVVGLYVRLRLSETHPFQATVAEGPGAPTLAIVWRRYGPTVRAGFLLVGVLAGTVNLWFVFLPSYFVAAKTHTLPVALGCAATGLLTTAITAPVFGRLSDRLGRRPLLIAGTAALCVLAIPLYAVASTGSWITLLVADLLVGAALGMLVISAHLSERFALDVRATGIAMTYGLATAVIGGTAPLIGSLLAQGGLPLGVPVYVVALSAAGLVAALRQSATVTAQQRPPMSATAPVPRSAPPSEGNSVTS